MFKVYEYIYPTATNQTDFIPVNNIESCTVKALVNATTELTYTLSNITVGKKTKKQLILSSPIQLQDYLVLEIETNTLLPIGNRSNCFIKTYGGTQRLLNNQSYTVTVDISSDIPPIEMSFTSRYDPFYCTTKMVRDDIDHIVSLSDDTINWIIFDNSLKVLTTMKGSGDLNYDLPVPYQLKDPQKIPFNVQQYVRYTTEYDILYAVYLTISGKSGRISKKLGDMQIDKEINIPFINDMLRGVREKLSGYPLTIAGVSKVKTFIKGDSYEPWPVSSPRRSF